MNTLVQRLQNRIDDQRKLIEQRLSHKAPDISQYYWGRSELNAHGIATRPNRDFSLLPQLLATPKLIVDIHPLPTIDFVSLYGLTPRQMTILAEDGFIIPNMYFYKNDGWKKYSQYPEAAELLIAHGRPNSEWISAYLDKQHGFARKEQLNVEMLRRPTVAATERKRIIAACNGRLKDWNTFAPIYGTRLTYIEVLGGEAFRNLVDFIKNDFQIPGRRAEAVHLINSAYFLTAKTMTAAYGAKAAFTPEDIRELSAAQPLVESLTPLAGTGVVRRKKLEIESRVRQSGEQRYLTDLVKRIADFNHDTQPSAFAEPLSELSNEQFAAFRDALWSVKDGEVGRAVDQMTLALARDSEGFEIAARHYREMEKDLNSKLRCLSPIGTFLADSGAMMLNLGERGEGTAPAGSDVGDGSELVMMIGGVALGWGVSLGNAEFIHQFWGKYPHRLLGGWKAMRDALQLSSSRRKILKP
jgi:hypothetical protein